MAQPKRDPLGRWSAAERVGAGGQRGNLQFAGRELVQAGGGY